MTSQPAPCWRVVFPPASQADCFSIFYAKNTTQRNKERQIILWISCSELVFLKENYYFLHCHLIYLGFWCFFYIIFWLKGIFLSQIDIFRITDLFVLILIYLQRGTILHKYEEKRAVSWHVEPFGDNKGFNIRKNSNTFHFVERLLLWNSCRTPRIYAYTYMLI